MKSYCIFCKTGTEKDVERRINKLYSDIKAIAPVRVLSERYAGKWELRERLMIPGYVFLYYKYELASETLRAINRDYKILEYQEGQRELLGYDYDYAMWIYRHDGIIGESRILYEGSTVKVIDGPLLEGIGTIVKLDKHKRRAWINFDFYGKTQRISLSVQDITPY